MNPESYVRYSFPGVGVWILAPANLDITISPAAHLVPAMAVQDDIQVLRFIGNLKFMDPDDPSRTHFEFYPPVQFQVRYAAADVDRARRRGKDIPDLAFAWWNGSSWQKLDEGGDPILEMAASNGGFKYFLLPAIDDPAIIWGT